MPYAAGGAVDVLARTLGQSLSKTWGQQPVIENRPGAGGTIASQALTQSAPDGYTLILVASGHPLNQFFYPKLPYDTFKDFTAISEIAYSPPTGTRRRTGTYGAGLYPATIQPYTARSETNAKPKRLTTSKARIT